MDKQNNTLNNKQIVLYIIVAVIVILILIFSGALQNTLSYLGIDIGNNEYKKIVTDYCNQIDSKMNYDLDVTIHENIVTVWVKARDRYTNDKWGSPHRFEINKNTKEIITAPTTWNYTY